MKRLSHNTVTPAKAGVWLKGIPAFAGMTMIDVKRSRYKRLTP
jgi:hypothetical protein